MTDIFIPTEFIRVERKWKIEKYESETAYAAKAPWDIVEFDGNVLLQAGITEALKLIGGISAVAFSNANAYLGVGDSSTAASAAQTGLQASTNKLYKAMEAGYPLVNNQTIGWRSVFGSAEANFAWQEYSVSNTNSDAGVNLNRKVSSQGTKSAGQVWTLDLSITFS